MTQNEKILSVLRSGKTLTSFEAASRYGIQNLRARVDELRNHEGYKILSTRFTRKATNSSAVKYSLARGTRKSTSR